MREGTVREYYCADSVTVATNERTGFPTAAVEFSAYFALASLPFR
jgi:hypothetical protein